MLVQNSTGQSMDLQSFLTVILAVSIAVERIVELIKQTVGTWPVIKWLFTPNTSPAQDSWRCAMIHLLSAVFGGLIAASCNLTLAFVNGFWQYRDPECTARVSYVLIGLLSAGGSAFWNHALDLVKAAKVQKEQTAKLAVATTRGLTNASAVNL